MITDFPQLVAGSNGNVPVTNELLDALAPYFPLTQDHANSTGLVLAVFGGRFNGSTLAAQTVTLTASMTCYVFADATTGDLDFNTTGYPSGPLPLGIAVTSSTGIVSYTQEARVAGAGGIGGATLTAVNVWTKNQSVSTVALTDGSSIATDASLSNNFKVTLGGNRTLANPTNATEGMWLHWAITQDGTGSRTLAYGTAFKWPAGTPPVLSTVAGSKDTIAAYYDGSAWLASCMKGFA